MFSDFADYLAYTFSRPITLNKAKLNTNVAIFGFRRDGALMSPCADRL